MNKPEAGVYAKVNKSLKPCPIKLKRVENSMDTGTPDVYYYSANNEGWIEFKYIKSFPKRIDTLITIPFRPGQYAWLISRYNLNNSTSGFLLIQIEDVIFLFKNSLIQEKYTRAELLDRCDFMINIKSKGLSTCLFNALNSLNRP